MLKYILTLLGGFVLIMVACQGPEIQERSTAFSFKEKLSDYHFFKGDLANLQPNDQVIPYELNSTLFTDYAYKKRFIYLPEGGQMTYNGEGLPIFPEGSILIKNFYYHLDERNPDAGQQIMETRLLVREGERWKVGVYNWNESQTEAVHDILGSEKPFAWIDKNGEKRSITYKIPDNNDCKSCHRMGDEILPVGPKVRNLNRETAVGFQLQSWQSRGVLSGLPTDSKDIAQLTNWEDQSQPLEQRARAYLEINCGHCHSPKGPANNTALNLNIEETDPHKLGFCKGPVSAAQGSGDLRFDIVAGNPEASILLYRMNSAETGVAMPELGKSLVHEEGVALIREWIASMEAGSCAE